MENLTYVIAEVGGLLFSVARRHAELTNTFINNDKFAYFIPVGSTIHYITSYTSDRSDNELLLMLQDIQRENPDVEYVAVRKGGS